MDNKERLGFLPEVEEATVTKRKKKNQPSYKGINEAMRETLAEKNRTIESLKKENESLKQALQLFIG